jgi:hypothetical protein
MPQSETSITFARGDSNLLLLKPVKGAMLAAKPPEAGECRFKCIGRQQY